MSPQEFVFRTLQVGDTNREGLFLPAPSEARVPVTIPPGGVFDFILQLVPPETGAPDSSDGATLIVQFEDAGHQALERWSIPARRAMGEAHRLDLSSHAGISGTLVLQTDPGSSTEADYVFVADPVLHSPEDDPPRVVIVFIDTLRADHLSSYGYERSTTPRLDTWAEDAAIFTQARSVAPWTLPSARTLLTGAVPERWGSVDSVQQQLSGLGWATSFVGGNVYLSSNFDMAEDWGEHRCINWPAAQVQVNRALDFVSRHPDRPVFQVLHLMDMHLPYTEPRRYRHLFAGETPDALEDDYFLHREVKKAARKMGKEGKQYVRNRYDNNLRHVDDQVARYLEALPSDALVVIMSDHGEEFWEHGGFEHGHTLYDELLRVPLIVKGGGVTPGRYNAPTSLLDIAPTLARALGTPSDEMSGWPLQDLADGSRKSDFETRPLTFGRPLYGPREWGVLTNQSKFTTTKGKERIFDLEKDPGEKKNLRSVTSDTTSFRAAMGTGMESEAILAFRVSPTAKKSRDDLVVELTVPGGVQAAFPAEDYLRSSKVEVEVEDEVVRATWLANHRGSRELFVVPNRPAETIANELLVSTQAGKNQAQTGPRSEEEPRVANDVSHDGRGRTLLRTRVGGRTITVNTMVVTLPIEGGTELAAVNTEVSAELEALGYLDPSEEPASEAMPTEDE